MSVTVQTHSPAGGTSTRKPSTRPRTTRGSASSDCAQPGQQRAQAGTAPPRIARKPRLDERRTADAQG